MSLKISTRKVIDYKLDNQDHELAILVSSKIVRVFQLIISTRALRLQKTGCASVETFTFGQTSIWLFRPCSFCLLKNFGEILL